MNLGRSAITVLAGLALCWGAFHLPPLAFGLMAVAGGLLLLVRLATPHHQAMLEDQHDNSTHTDNK